MKYFDVDDGNHWRYLDMLEQIELKQKEAQRLVGCLRFYRWLQNHGVDPENICGVSQKIPWSHKVWSEVDREIRGMYHTQESVDKGQCKRLPPKNLISFRMTDGSSVVLPWPPFSDDVIYNRSLL